MILQVYSIGMHGGEYSRGDGKWHRIPEAWHMTEFGAYILCPPCQSIIYVVDSLEYHDMMPRNDLVVAGMAVIDPETGETLLLTRQS